MVKAFNREFEGQAWTEYKGLSNDPRPLNPKPGDVFIETDTLDLYVYFTEESSDPSYGLGWVWCPYYGGPNPMALPDTGDSDEQISTGPIQQ